MSLQPGTEDPVTQACRAGHEYWERLEAENLQSELGGEIIDELAKRYHIEKPIISAAQGRKHAKAVKAFADWCDALGFDEYLNLLPCYTAIFLDEKIRAGAKRSEIKALVDGISYAHRRVWLADPTTDPIVKAVIRHKEK
jgi:hypothetical protein